MIGTLRARIEGWKSERDKLVEHLSSVVKDAQDLLSGLGHRAEREARKLVARKRQPRAVEADVAPHPRRRRRRMSAQARAKIAAAQRKRWAAKRKAEAK
jgi:hypothetical protein